MDLHLVNGFLGSGKTTGIIGASKHLIGKGQLVGIITNDKGQFQVDRAFFEGSEIPTRQVTGGCFRCSFSEFEEIIAELQGAASPDVIFAESVGSCVDLINTIFDPLQKIERIQVTKTTFSVFTDSRLFQIWIQNEPLPFSDKVNYLFEKQIEEGRILVLNKIDLLTKEEQAEINSLARLKFPHKTILFQNSSQESGMLPWLDRLEKTDGEPNRPDFKVSYYRYMSGEQEMAWLDQKLFFRSTLPENIRPAIIKFIRHIHDGLQSEDVMIGHIKFLIGVPPLFVKISFTTADFMENSVNQNWIELIPNVEMTPFPVLINARLSMEAEEFHGQVNWVIESISNDGDIIVDCEEGSAYNPVMSMQRP
jgi:Ni2+-binding GTPase involved in maturation of urease and hydrogenase